MGKRDDYAAQLRAARHREGFLMANSGLPGPRGNLELAEAAADVGSPVEIRRWAAIGPDEAGTNEPLGFVAVCGVLGLGRLAVEGDTAALDELRGHANDPRWRVREAVAMALQRVGDAGMDELLRVADAWAEGSAYERRAAAAAVAEPRLLRDPVAAEAAVRLFDRITTTFERKDVDRMAEDRVALRKGLGYGWSVVIAADPDHGKGAFERWLASDDPDVRWICRENLKKARLAKLDPSWVAACRARLK
jgi:hypothetical protein